MAACVEIWESDPEALHYHGSRLRRARAAGAGAGPGRGLRAPAADRLPLRAAHRARARSRAHMREPIRRLAGRGPERLPARATPAASPSTASRWAGWPTRRGRRGADRRGRRGDRLRARRLGRRDRGRDERRADRGRAGGGRGRPVDPAPVGDARASPTGSTSTSPTAASSTTCRCGPTGTCRRARWRCRRRPSTPPAAPSRPCSTSTPTGRCATTRGGWSARSPWGIYVKPDRDSVQGGAQPLPVGEEFEVDPYPTGTVEPGFPDLWCAALSHCMERFEGCRARVPPGALGRRRRLHRRQLPGLRPHARQRLRRRRLEPRLQDDRRRPRDRRESSRASTPRCCTRSATSASPPATCTPSRTAPIRGAERRRAGHVVIGGGVLGLSAAWRLAERGADVLVLEKDRIGARRLRRRRRDRPQLLPLGRDHRADPALGRDVRGRAGCLRLPPGRLPGGRAAEAQVEDLVAIREQHERAGYDSELVVGAEALPRVPRLDLARLGGGGRGACCTSAAAAGPTRCRPFATSPRRARDGRGEDRRGGRGDRVRARRRTGSRRC